MQVGDRRQAGMLGVVAVGAIGFLIFQLVPKADAHIPAPQRSAPNATIDASGPPPVAPIPARSADVTLARDPFAVAPRARPRPSLASASDPANEGSDQNDAAKHKGTIPAKRPRGGDLLPMTAPTLVPATYDASGSLPPLTKSVPGGGAPLPGKSPSTKASPEAPAPVDGVEKDPVRKETPVALLGIVEMPAPVAMMRVGTTERTLRVGDEIVPGLRIAKITLAGITFVNRPGRVLAPGEETLL